LERAGSVFVDVVGTKPQTPLTEVTLRGRASANDHRVSLLPDIDQPNSLFTFLTVVFHRLIDGHHELSSGKRQSGVSVTAVGRAPVEAAGGFRFVRLGTF